jgi:hypothetical protein
MQSCEEFGELASLLAAKGEPFAIRVSRCAGRAYRSSWRGPGAAASLHDCYSLPAKLHTVFTPPTISYSNFYASGANYRGLSLLLDVVLDSTCRCVHRDRTGSHGDLSAPEHEIAARSTLALNKPMYLAGLPS